MTREQYKTMRHAQRSAERHAIAAKARPIGVRNYWRGVALVAKIDAEIAPKLAKEREAWNY